MSNIEAIVLRSMDGFEDFWRGKILAVIEAAGGTDAIDMDLERSIAENAWAHGVAHGYHLAAEDTMRVIRENGGEP